MEEKRILSPFRDGKQAYWCGPICKINNFFKYLKANKPILCGNWNPNEYVSQEHFKRFVKWLHENFPECLEPSCEDDVLYASMGTTFENLERQKNCVDIYDVVYKWIENFAGPCIDGSQVKASAFGPIGIGSRFWANHYYRKGGILIRGKGEKPGEREMVFALFFPKKVWKAMGISVQDNAPDDEEFEEFIVDLD